MKTNNTLYNEQLDCCCCCYCCCYSNSPPVQSPIIPPWQPSANHIPNMDSTCSCCSCNSSSIIEEEAQSPTTPIISQSEKFKQKKLHAIQELQQTERDYVLDLSHLVQVSWLLLFHPLKKIPLPLYPLTNSDLHCSVYKYYLVNNGLQQDTN